MACLPMFYPPCPATGVWRKASEKFQVDSSDVNVAACRLPIVGHTRRPFPHDCMVRLGITCAQCGVHLGNLG